MRRSALALNRDEDEVFSTLLAPLKLGKFNLNHRVVLAPVTRCRALNYVPQRAHIDYYAQRTTPGGLLISEAVAVSQQGIGFPHSPGIWNDEQVEAWKKVVKAVHDKGGIIFCQLWHVGRASHTFYQPEGCQPVSSTEKKISEDWSIRLPDGLMAQYSRPRALATEEIPAIVDQFRQAAKNALKAGFDGVEIHAGHGYLVDQFFKDGINDRDDAYGGSIENRCRFGLEVLSAVAGEVGPESTAIRVSPVIDHIGAMDSDPHALGHYLIHQLNKVGLAYLHITEPRFTNQGVKETDEDITTIMQEYKGHIISSGGYTRESGIEAIKSGRAHLISYGRLFISNPDLPLRFALNAPLNRYDRTTFYTHHQIKGYLDYPALNTRDLLLRSRSARLSVVPPPICSPKYGRAIDASLSPRTPIIAASPRLN